MPTQFLPLFATSVLELPPPSELALAFAAVFVGAMVQGGVGFGLAVVAAPILLMLNPEWVPGSLLVASLLLSILMALRERRSIAVKEVAYSSLGRLLATIPTAYLIGSIDQQMFSVVFATAILIAVAISMSGYHLKFNHTNLVVASVISGATNTIAAIGGPPMALIYQSQQGPHIRATLAVIFGIGTSFSMLALAWFGQFGLRDLVLGGILLPAIFAGFATSRFTTPWIDARATRPALLGLAGLSAIVILLRTLFFCIQ